MILFGSFLYAAAFDWLFSSDFAMLASSVFIDILPGFIKFQPMEDYLMARVFGGALVGVALGIQLWVGATTGVSHTEISENLGMGNHFRKYNLAKKLLVFWGCI